MLSDLTLATVASMLRRGRSLDQLSGYLTAVALAWGLMQWPLGAGSLVGTMLAIVMILAGLLQKCWAIRVAFAAELFSRLASGAGDLSGRTAEQDQALITLGLIAPVRARRPWPERSRHAMGLLRVQASLLAFQAALAVSSLISMPWVYSSILR